MERRRHPRVPLGISMDIHGKDQTVRRFRGAIADLSVGGMTFKTNAAIDEGATLYLKVNIPLEIRGEVRHMKSSSSGGMHRYGVRFHKFGFTARDKAKAENFITAKFQKTSITNGRKG